MKGTVLYFTIAVNKKIYRVYWDMGISVTGVAWGQILQSLSPPRIHWLLVSHNITLFMLLYLLSNKDVITIRAIYFFLNFLFMLSCLNRSYATDVNSSIFAGINNVYIMFMHFVRCWCLLFISAEWSLMELPHPFLTFCFRIYFH
jgi:hypothetical protein